MVKTSRLLTSGRRFFGSLFVIESEFILLMILQSETFAIECVVA